MNLYDTQIAIIWCHLRPHHHRMDKCILNPIWITNPDDESYQPNLGQVKETPSVITIFTSNQSCYHTMNGLGLHEYLFFHNCVDCSFQTNSRGLACPRSPPPPPRLLQHFFLASPLETLVQSLAALHNMLKFCVSPASASTRALPHLFLSRLSEYAFPS